MQRTQIYLAEEQSRLLEERAASVGATKSALIRDAIDAFLAPDSDRDGGIHRFRAAVAQASGIAPHLPAGGDYVDEARSDDRVRERALDVRREK